MIGDTVARVCSDTSTFTAINKMCAVRLEKVAAITQLILFFSSLPFSRNSQQYTWMLHHLETLKRWHFFDFLFGLWTVCVLSWTHFQKGAGITARMYQNSQFPRGNKHEKCRLANTSKWENVQKENGPFFQSSQCHHSHQPNVSTGTGWMAF